jgi:hypothetical protein
MVGNLMVEFAAQSGLSPELNVSLVERYTDGLELSEGYVQGLRFDILNGQPSFRSGAQQHEQADVTVEVTTAAARQLNLLLSGDPHYKQISDHFLSTGELRVSGDIAKMGGWLSAVHDPIVSRTE